MPVPVPLTRRTAAVLLAASVALAGAGCSRAADRQGAADTGATGGATAPGGVVVQMRALRFTPAEVTVGVGQPVTWRDAEDVPHTVTTGRYTVGGDGTRTSEAKDGRLDRRVDRAGATVTYSFGASGRYQYLCTYHPGMNGVVVVR